MAKSLYNNCCFNLAHSIIVSVQTCDDLEFVKRFPKVLMKFHGKASGPWAQDASSKMVDPHNV